MPNQEVCSTITTTSSTSSGITVSTAIWAKMQSLLTLLPDPETQEESTSLPPEDPAPAAPSPAINVYTNPAVESPNSKASIDGESNKDILLPNSNTMTTGKTESAPLSINTDGDHNQIPSIDPIADKNLVANGQTTPLLVITDMKGYRSFMNKRLLRRFDFLIFYLVCLVF
jgi:hypothetical protein